MDCKSRCKDNRPLCTASTDSFFELDWGDPTPLLHSVFSDDPNENPAFHDFNIGKKSKLLNNLGNLEFHF